MIKRLWLPLAVFIVPTMAFAQLDGSLFGIITSRGYKLPGVAVTLVPDGCMCAVTQSRCCEYAAAVISDDAGYYVFTNVHPGRYDVKPRVIGVEPTTITVDIRPGSKYRLNVDVLIYQHHIETNEPAKQNLYVRGLRPLQPIVLSIVVCKCSEKCPSDHLCACCPSGLVLVGDAHGALTANVPVGRYQLVVPSRDQKESRYDVVVQPNTRTMFDVHRQRLEQYFRP